MGRCRSSVRARSRRRLRARARSAAAGCCRDGHIGRMAVLADWRGRGVGAALLLRPRRTCARGRARDVQSSMRRCSAMPFYARHGFAATGEAFEEAGILHQIMDRPLR